MADTDKVVVAVIYPTDPAGHIIGGVETFIRGLIKYSPEDIEYVVIGATTNPSERPLFQWTICKVDGKSFRYLPIIRLYDGGKQSLFPATLRYEMAALRHMPDLANFQVLESHRIEHFILRGKGRTRINLFLHQNMSVLRDKQSDIRWRYLPSLYYFLEKRVLHQVNSIFAVREDAVADYQSRHPEIANRFNFQPTWMDPDIFYPVGLEKRNQLRKFLCTRYSVPEDDGILVAVGRLDYQKDPLLLIRAMSILLQERPDVRLLWVGDGILHDDVVRVAEGVGISDRIVLTGLLNPHEIADIHRAADLFVMSSAYEGMPIALIEALGCGLPAVTTDVGEVRRLIDSGVNGEICSVRTAERLAGSIIKCLDKHEHYRGEPCTMRALQYTPQRVLTPLYDNYRGLVAESNLGS